MATTATPQAPGQKKYEPKNKLFFNNLRRVCLRALEGPPVRKAEDAHNDPLFTQAYGMLDGISFFSDSGVIAPILADGYCHDVEALHQEFKAIQQNSDGEDLRMRIILDKLAELRFYGTFSIT